MTNESRWIVPADHPAFAGHFPGNPILPGVVLLDVVLQTISTARGIALDTCEVGSVKFLSPALPGDELLIQYECSAKGTIRFDIMAGVRTVANGRINPGIPP